MHLQVQTIFVNKPCLPAAFQVSLQHTSVKGDISGHLWWTNYFFLRADGRRKKEFGKLIAPHEIIASIPIELIFPIAFEISFDCIAMVG